MTPDNLYTTQLCVVTVPKLLSGQLLVVDNQLKACTPETAQCDTLTLL